MWSFIARLPDARLAGALYLVIIGGGLFAEAVVRQQLVVLGNADATAANILAHESLYRWGFAVSLVYLACNVPLALLLRRIFAGTNALAAQLVAAFILVGTAIETTNLLNHFAPLIYLKGSVALGAFAPAELHALAYVSLRTFGMGFSVCLVFFACYDLLIGYLIVKSRYLPRTIGILMAIAGVCYLTDSFARILAPPVANMLFPYILLPSFVGELSLCLWLLLKGVNLRT